MKKCKTAKRCCGFSIALNWFNPGQNIGSVCTKTQRSTNLPKENDESIRHYNEFGTSALVKGAVIPK